MKDTYERVQAINIDTGEVLGTNLYQNKWI